MAAKNRTEVKKRKSSAKAESSKAVLDYTRDVVIRRGQCFDPKTPYCERCGQEIKDVSKAVPVTMNCDTFEVFLGHDVETGYHNKSVVGNTDPGATVPIGFGC